VQQEEDYIQQALDEATLRELLASQAQAPRLQTGPLVIASTVLKKDLRKHQRGVKAVEMEAAGMMYALSSMDDPVNALIRQGISECKSFACGLVLECDIIVNL
jgi:hypothetical protein